jgi:pyruvate,orthophosphate dikinase
MKELLGGKGANLAEMTSIGLPVPPASRSRPSLREVLRTRAGSCPHGLMDEVQERLAMLEKETGKKFGDHDNPLLVSVRSGAKVSMPGMMDTVLNLGLNDDAVEGLAEATGNERFAYDAYRRLINMFGDVVMGVDHEHFDRVRQDQEEVRRQLDTDVPAEGLEEAARPTRRSTSKQTGEEPFPQDPIKQLELAIEAVFKSWNSRAPSLPPHQQDHRACSAPP